VGYQDAPTAGRRAGSSRTTGTQNAWTVGRRGVVTTMVMAGSAAAAPAVGLAGLGDLDVDLSGHRALKRFTTGRAR
jgi:hypothetical protein